MPNVLLTVKRKGDYFKFQADEVIVAIIPIKIKRPIIIKNIMHPTFRV